MTDSNGQGDDGLGTDDGTGRDILAALRAINSRLDRLEDTVGRLTAQAGSAGPAAGHALGAAEPLTDPVHESLPAAPGRREPTLGRLPPDERLDTDAAPDEEERYHTDGHGNGSGEIHDEAAGADRPQEADDEPPGPDRDVDVPLRPAARRERSGVRGVATFLVAVALLAGGIYWLSQNLDWRDTLPAEWLGRDADPAAATSAGTDADGAAADGEDAESLIADAAPGEQADHGTGAESEAEPAMPAVPRPSVRVVELSEGVAPLPDDASPELRETARRAQEGDPQAQHDLATLYAIGQQVSQDYERAAFWFARAADAGIVNAVYNLGVLTQRGDGVEQDSAAAFRLFRRAAEEGHAQAQYALGLAYVGGRGVDRDLQEAASWFQAASANGFPRGAYYLGRLYEEGFEGEPDPAAAAGWYRIAAEAGDPDAEEALERLTDAGTEPAGPLELEGSVPVPDRAPEPEAPGGTAAGDGEAVELSRDDIREIQTRLDELGYDPGPVDGLMGDRTESAIAAFQQDRGLEADGEPSPALLDRLREAEPAG